MSDHWVRHYLQSGEMPRTEFECRAMPGGECRIVCKPCHQQRLERCQCGGVGEKLDLGTCGWLVFILEGDIDWAFDGVRQPVRGPEWQPIRLIWSTSYDTYFWDYDDVLDGGVS